MKKKIVIIVSVIIAILVILYIVRSFPSGICIIGKKVLIEESYLNNAWSFTYDGTIICTDGTMYKFIVDEKDRDRYFNIDNLNQESKFLLRHVVEEVGKIEEKDLNRIKELLEVKINPKDVSDEYVGSDMGSQAIYVYDYQDDKIEIRGSGGSNIQNNGENVQEILDILKKYEIEVKFWKWPFFS